MVYLNLTRVVHTLKPVSEVKDEWLNEFRHWKSVSVVANNVASVLYVSDPKQHWLKEHVGQLYSNQMHEVTPDFFMAEEA